MIFPPALIGGLSQDPEGLKYLSNLRYLYFAGVPCSQKTAEKLVDHVPVKPEIGSTEADTYFFKLTGEEDWEYYAFRPALRNGVSPGQRGLL